MINNIGPWECPYCGAVDPHDWLACPSSEFPMTDIMQCIKCSETFYVTWDTESSEGVVSKGND